MKEHPFIRKKADPWRALTVSNHKRTTNDLVKKIRKPGVIDREDTLLGSASIPLKARNPRGSDSRKQYKGYPRPQNVA